MAFMEATGEIPVVTKHDGSVVDDPHDPDVRDAMKVQKSRMLIISIALPAYAVLSGSLLPLQLLLQQVSVAGSHITGVKAVTLLKISNGQVAIYQGVNTDVFGYP